MTDSKIIVLKADSVNNISAYDKDNDPAVITDGILYFSTFDLGQQYIENKYRNINNQVYFAYIYFDFKVSGVIGTQTKQLPDKFLKYWVGHIVFSTPNSGDSRGFQNMVKYNTVNSKVFLNKISGNINLTFNDDKKSVLYTDINFNDSVIILDDIYDEGRYLRQDSDPIIPKDAVINYIKNSQWYPTKLKDPNTYYIPLYMKLIPL